MDVWRWHRRPSRFAPAIVLSIALLVLLSTGCRTARLTEPLERENRHLEDHIYYLEDQLNELQAQLDSCRRENCALRQQTNDRPFIEGTTPRATTSDLTPPVTELGPSTSGMPGAPAPSEEAPPFRSPPIISPPDPSRPDGELAPGEPLAPEPEQEPPAGASTDAGDIGPVLEDAKLPTSATPISTDGKPTEITDYNVVEIALNPRLTGGHDRDNKHPGDEGILVVVEPRNKAKQALEVPADISIVVLDPALEGSAARIARWDFSADEAAEHYKRGLFGEGFEFELPWPNNPPAHPDLMLFVRYTLPTRQQFVVDKPIKVDLTGEVVDHESVTEGTPTPATDGAVPADEEHTVRGPTDWRQSERPRASQGIQPRRIVSQPTSPLPRQAQLPTSAPDRRRRPQWGPGR